MTQPGTLTNRLVLGRVKIDDAVLSLCSDTAETVYVNPTSMV
jgi:hypothetical protein